MQGPFAWYARWPALIAPITFAATAVLVASVLVAPCDLQKDGLPLLSGYMRNYGYPLEDFCALFKRAVLIVLLIPPIAMGHMRYLQLGPNGRGLFLGFVSATALVSVSLIAREWYLSYVEPHTWDFLPFYIDGPRGSLGLKLLPPAELSARVRRVSHPFRAG